MKTARFKALLRPAYGAVRDTWERRTYKPTGRYPIVIQGIQRSGTNYLSEVLARGEYRVLNVIDPPRDDPRHKHFRWHPDKAAIAMDARYRNDLTAQSAAEVNRLAGWPEGSRHLVLFRDPEDWLHAIFRWGQANAWFRSEQEFIETGRPRAFLREWHGFYAQWQAFAATSPDLVLLLRLADLRRDPAAVLTRIDDFAGVGRAAPVAVPEEIRKVRHSRPLQAPRAPLDGPARAAIAAAVAEEGAFDWRAHLPEGEAP